MDTCPICLGDNPNFKLSICGHKFHKECIEQWLAIKPECPLCRCICINTFPYYYRFNIIKKGNLIIDNNKIIIKQNKFLKGKCRLAYKNICFSAIKRIEYDNFYFNVFYFKNNILKVKKFYTRDSKIIFNVCKYHFYNNNRTILI